jgi:glycosyltransferase involved in cell wall biosynthesis
LVSASGGNNNTSLFPSFPSVQNPPPLSEVIIVDDCSTDNTAEVVQNWITSYISHLTSHSSLPTSHVLRFTLHALPANGGPAVARNKGIQEAKGEWIAFLDADDIWLPHKLELQMSLAAEHPEVAMWCGERIDFSQVDGAPNGQTLEVLNKNLSFGGILRSISLKELAVFNFIATSSVLVVRQVLANVGGFDKQFRGPEDYDLWLRILAQYPVVSVNSSLVGYRHVPGSLSLNDRTFLPQVLKVLKKAYSKNGVHGGKQGYAKAAAYQYLSASWSAAERGDVWRAVQNFSYSFVLRPWPLRGATNVKWERFKMVFFIIRAGLRKTRKIVC